MRTGRQSTLARYLKGVSIAAIVALASSTAAFAADLTIGYVTKSATNQGWILISQGAADAAKEAGVELITVGPSAANDLGGQLATIENMINRKVNALAIAPADSSGVTPAVEKAIERNIPVVAIDTAIYGAKVTSFVATDNLAAAAAQGKWVAENIDDNGSMILVNGSLGQSTGRDRHDGFVKALKDLKPNVTIYEVQTKWDQTEAQNGVEALLRAHPEVSVIANAWDGGTMGAIAALKAARKTAGEIKIVGFDGAPDALKQMKLGWVQCDIAQLLYMQGFKGVTAAIQAARGEKVEERIDTGHAVVVPDNLEKYVQDNHLGSL
ncbi:sugar ABC transporter substrate-binding protein [Shinella zoogloeoides]|uniref:sugar ABC transporter substrate-binding protein n=1 Tax=Shinella zoogloeoides TaxID=352475 RepID=UPI0013C2C265|nr:sugar ABC transporter substrate-binding protein [Shinella zoogloeoides]